MTSDSSLSSTASFGSVSSSRPTSEAATDADDKVGYTSRYAREHPAWAAGQLLLLHTGDLKPMELTVRYVKQLGVGAFGRVDLVELLDGTTGKWEKKALK
jgi:hypothetical protein